MSVLKFVLRGSLLLGLVVGGVSLVSGCGSGDQGDGGVVKATPEQEKAVQEIGQSYKDRYASKTKTKGR